MSEFINTIDVLGDDAVIDGIIDKSITEFRDDVLTTIFRYAFYNCAELVTLDLPNVETIDGYAFSNCISLQNVNLPKAKTFTRQSTFSNCGSLKELYLPSATALSGWFADMCSSLEKVCLPVLPKLTVSSPFDNCPALRIVDLPMVTEVGGTYTFRGSGNLIALILRSSTMAVNSGANFSGSGINKGTGYIYVPRALADSYKSATNWSAYASQFRALEDFTVDGTITGELDETKI